MCNKEFICHRFIKSRLSGALEGLFYFALVTCSTMLPLLLKKLDINSH